MASKNRLHEVTITGIVTPAEWDDEENVTSVRIETDDDEQYLIESGGKGDRLLDYIDEYVKVTGTVHDVEGENHLAVRHFVHLEEDNALDEEGSFDEDEDAR